MCAQGRCCLFQADSLEDKCHVHDDMCVQIKKTLCWLPPLVPGLALAMCGIDGTIAWDDLQYY